MKHHIAITIHWANIMYANKNSIWFTENKINAKNWYLPNKNMKTI